MTTATHTRARTLWSTTEDDQLRALLAASKTPCAIAKVLNRSESSVYRRMDILANKPKAAARRCMCCGHDFPSDGPHNRLCSTCRNRSFSPYAP